MFYWCDGEHVGQMEEIEMAPKSDNARATLCLTVDNLGVARDVGLGVCVRPDADEPGIRYGVPRILGLFAELGVPSTFFVEGWNGLHHRDVLDAILTAGHEIGLHGWVHEAWASLDPGQQERLLWDGTAALRMAGAEPRGFRAPGGYRGERTADVLTELGYAYDSSIEPDQEGAALTVAVLPQGLVNVPWDWDAIDYWQYEMHPDGSRTPEQALTHWNGLLDHAIDIGGLVTLIVHPFVTGVELPKYEALRRFLTRAVEDDRVDIRNAAQVAESYLRP